MYGAPEDTSPSALHLSSIMIDYWVSFATSLDPNDGHGNARKCLIDHRYPDSFEFVCLTWHFRSSMGSIHT